MKFVFSKQEAIAFGMLIDKFIGMQNRFGCEVEGGKFKCTARDFAKTIENDINVKLQGEGYKDKVVSIFLNPLTSNVCVVMDDKFVVEFLELYGTALWNFVPVMCEFLQAVKKANDSLKESVVTLEPVFTEFGKKWFPKKPSESAKE